MSSFFAGAWQNIHQPEIIINGPSGALPPSDTGGLGHGMNAVADARINYNSTLFGDLTPYAYGKPGRLSSQTAYLAIPHMLQKVVPVLSVPAAQFPGKSLSTFFHFFGYTFNSDTFVCFQQQETKLQNYIMQ